MATKIDADTTASHKTLLLFTLLLFSGKRHYLAHLSSILQCSKATVMRLIQTIELSGVALIETDLDKGKRWYQLKTLPSTPHIGLTGEEVEKLALCRDLVERILPEGIEKIISESISKVSTLMANSECRAKATSSKAIRVTHGYIDYSNSQEHIDTLLKAISSNSVCLVTYSTPHKKELQEFYVLPIRLAVEDDCINMEGWRISSSVGSGSPPEIRFATTLAVHRMHSCKNIDIAMPTRPELPEERGLFGLIGRESFTIRVEFDRYAAPYIKERIWGKDQILKNKRGGGVELTCNAGSEEQVIEWLLRFGSCAELLEPTHLRERILEEAQAITDKYLPEEDE